MNPGSPPFFSQAPAPSYLDPRGYQAALSQQLQQLSACTPAGYAVGGKQNLVYMAPRPFVPIPYPQQQQQKGPAYATPRQAQQQPYQQQQENQQRGLPQTRMSSRAAPRSSPPTTSDFRGWLMKQKKTAALKGWDRRWCELRGSVLSYYERDDSSVPCRVVCIHGGSVRDAEGVGRQAIEVKTPKDTWANSYVFASDAGGDLGAWKDALAAACLLPEGPVTPHAAGEAPRLVALVNGKSGGKQGEALIKAIGKHLGPDNVWD
eukprot:CAMPEP_0172042396 /NCGR_PEP_ID=MMETSP1041-20130122/25655_1 /TAXON_ID=464988 /ORGANISM="Hemiselmis andersenii, Strain CCMP439" /LENGTH=261 /DNA_ID=CAMNT_0012700649 /DNA_START=3 /DNA_END=785 /DNA_ORIENTATION=-